MRAIVIITLCLVQVLYAQQKPTILYIADPLCSWCYGFQLEMDQVIAKYADLAKFEILVGGMGTENKKPLDPQFAAALKEHWIEVHTETSQPFDTNILATKGLIYNSEPICRAIVTAKSMDSTKGIVVHKALQKAFYSENKDVTKLIEIQKCIFKLELDTAKFAQLYLSEELKKKTQEEFNRVDKNGVDGFPVLLVITDKKTVLITDGYTKFKNLDKKLKKIFNSK